MGGSFRQVAEVCSLTCSYPRLTAQLTEQLTELLTGVFVCFPGS